MTSSNDLDQALDALQAQARRRQDLLSKLTDLQVRAGRLQAEAMQVHAPAPPRRSRPLWFTVLALQISTVGLLYMMSTPEPEVSETLVALADAEPAGKPEAAPTPAEPPARQAADQPAGGQADEAGVEAADAETLEPPAAPEAVAEVTTPDKPAPAAERPVEAPAVPTKTKRAEPRTSGPTPGAFHAVTAFPFHHQGNTRIDGERLFESYDCAPSVKEEGPEHWFKVVVERSGRLVASIPETIDDGVDIDLHLLSVSDTGDCLVRAHRRLSHQVQPGTYWLVLDSYSGGGMELPGSYELTVGLQAD